MTLIFILAGIGAAVAAINFYLSFIRYPLHRLWYRERAFQRTSGFPLVGSFLLWIAALSFWLLRYEQYAAVALIISIFDTGGIHWFVVNQFQKGGHGHEVLKERTPDSDRRANKKDRD
jgi:hypothetical protein